MTRVLDWNQLVDQVYSELSHFTLVVKQVCAVKLFKRAPLSLTPAAGSRSVGGRSKNTLQLNRPAAQQRRRPVLQNPDMLRT